MSLFDIFTDAATQTGMPLKPQNSVLSLTGQVNHLFGEDHRFGGWIIAPPHFPVLKNSSGSHTWNKEGAPLLVTVTWQVPAPSKLRGGICGRMKQHDSRSACIICTSKTAPDQNQPAVKDWPCIFVSTTPPKSRNLHTTNSLLTPVAQFCRYKVYLCHVLSSKSAQENRFVIAVKKWELLLHPGLCTCFPICFLWWRCVNVFFLSSVMLP